MAWYDNFLASDTGGAGWGVPLISGLASAYGNTAIAGAAEKSALLQSQAANNALAYQKSRDAIEDKRYDAGQLATKQASDAMQQGFLAGFAPKKKPTTTAPVGLAETATYV
jgi:hypothetical protein